MNSNHTREEARRLKNGLKKLGYSHKEVMNFTDASISTVRRWTIGSHRIPDPEMIVLLFTTGISINYVRTGEGSYFASEEEIIQVIEGLQNKGFDRSKLDSDLQLNRIDHKARLLEFSDQDLLFQVTHSLHINPKDETLRSLLGILSSLSKNGQETLLKEAIRIQNNSLEDMPNI